MSEVEPSQETNLPPLPNRTSGGRGVVDRGHTVPGDGCNVCCEGPSLFTAWSSESNCVVFVAYPPIGAHIHATKDYGLPFILLGLLPLVSVAAILVFDSVVHGGNANAQRETEGSAVRTEY